MPTLSYQQHQIHYEQYGQGPRLLIALHGIGGRGRLFENVTRVMWADYTVLALDLPYHGSTAWTDTEYNSQQLAAVLQQLAQEQGHTEWDIMVHSMGGRLLLGLVPLLIDQLGQLYLFAPGGFQYVFIESRPWWTHWTRERLRRYFEPNEGFVTLLNGVHRLGLMNRQAHALFVQQVRTPERRARLFRSWVSLSHFPMRMPVRLRKLLLKHQLPLHFFVGDQDRITPAQCFRRFLKGYPYGTLQVVAGDHYFVQAALVAPFATWYAAHREQLLN